MAASLFFWGVHARAEHSPVRVLGWSVRPPIEQRLFVAQDMGITLGSFFPSAFDLRMTYQFAALESALRLEASAPPSIRFGGEPFERKVFDFQRKCLNPCPLGGWGTCVLETRVAQDECQAIAGRTLVSAAARRAPMVREVLKLVGSQTTKLPTDVDRGLQLSAVLVRGGGTVGIEARW